VTTVMRNKAGSNCMIYRAVEIERYGYLGTISIYRPFMDR